MPQAAKVAKPVYLMCAPEHFEVSYIINPWMKPEAWLNNEIDLKDKTQSGWQKLYEVFQSAGTQIELIKPQPNLPDMVFTANSAVVLDGKALLANFRYKERQGEEQHFSKHFQLLKDKGLLSAVDKTPANLIQEGAGDCLWDDSRQLFWAGYGPRSSKESTAYLQDYFGKEVIALELATPRFYHADVSISPLNSGTIVYYPAAFTKEAQKEILERIPAEDLIAVEDEDAHNFVCNLVNVNDKIILRQCSSRLKEILRDRGFKVIEAPVEVFALSGGSVCCLTLRLNWRSKPSHK